VLASFAQKAVKIAVALVVLVVMAAVMFI